MRTFTKWCLKGLYYALMAIVMLAVIVFCIFYFADYSRYKTTMEKSFKVATGYELKINGKMKAEIFPKFKLSLEDIEMPFDLNDASYSFTAKNIKFNMGIRNFFSGNYAIDNATMLDFSIIDAKKKTQLFHGESLQTGLKATQDYAKFSHLKLTHKTGTYTGDVRFVFYAKFNEVEGTIHSKAITLAAAKPTQSNDKALPDFAIPVALLKSYKGNLTVKADEIKLGDVAAQEASINFDLSRNTANIIFDGKVWQGNMHADLLSKALDQKTPNHQFSMKLRQANPQAILSKFNPEVKTKGGTAQFDLTLTGHGNQFASYIQNAQGKGQFLLRDVTIVGASAKSLRLTDILFNNLLKTRQEKLHCMVTKFTLDKGLLRADKGIGLETKYLVGLGSGSINLKTEAVDMVLELSPLKSSPITFTDFDGVVDMKGTLKKPIISASPKLMRETTSAILGIATGGLSLIGEALLNMTAGQSRPCEAILEAQ